MTFAPLPNGQEVIESAVTLSNTSGLHEALAVDQLELDHGDRVVLVLECEVRKVTFEATEKDDLQGPLRRVHALHVMGAAQHDTEAVRARLKEQAAKVSAAKGELPFGDGEPDEGAPGELCAHDLPPDECTDCAPLEGVQEHVDAQVDPEPAQHLHAVTG